jgi:hypothetical protein
MSSIGELFEKPKKEGLQLEDVKEAKAEAEAVSTEMPPAPIKKRRKRKPMTEEQKVSFREKMKAAKERKAKALALEMIQSQKGNPSPVATTEPVAQKPPARRVKKDTSSSISQEKITPTIDYTYFDSLNNSVKTLTSTLLDLQRASRASATPAKAKPERASPQVSQQISNPQKQTVSVQDSSNNQQPKKETVSTSPPSSIPERKKVWNVKRRQFVYV